MSDVLKGNDVGNRAMSDEENGEWKIQRVSLDETWAGN